MKYFEFLILFTVIPSALLIYLLRNYLQKTFVYCLLTVSLIAFIATSAWDNYAVYSGIWMFPKEKTLGIYLYYVPVEEYLFFFLQTYATGLFQIYYFFKFYKQDKNDNSDSGNTILNVTLMPALLLFFFKYIGGNIIQEEILKLPFGRWNYLFHLFSWAGLFIIIQYIFGYKKIKKHLKLIFIPSIFMTIFFSLADSVSIGNGIWGFDPAQTIGTKIGNVPLEEILFFFLTNVLITEAMILFLPEKILNKEKL